MTKSAGPALHDLYAEFGDRVEFLALYVREAHPGDHYQQPDQEPTKLAQARAYAVRDNIPWPVAVDDIEGTLHRRLDPKPHAAYVVSRDGDVVFRTLWANHTRTLRGVLEAVAEGDAAAFGEDESKVVAMIRGLGSFWETLSVAGPVALRDVAVQAPPMWLSGRIASFFRPLPPLGRGMAAGAVLAGAGAAVGLAWRGIRRS